MSEISYLQDRCSEDFHSQSFLLLSATNHAELCKQLASTLHSILVDKPSPVVIYQCLSAEALMPVGYFPIESINKSDNWILSIGSTQELTNSSLTYHGLKGKQQILGYIGYPSATDAKPAREIEALIEIAIHQWRLLDARRMAEQQARLNVSRILLNQDIQDFNHIEEIMERYAQSWCDAFQACGISLVYQDHSFRFGNCPTEHELSMLSALLNDESGQTHSDKRVRYDQGTLAIQLSEAGKHYGWLVLFRDNPLMAQTVDAKAHQWLSYWLACEADIALTLADDIATAIITLEDTHNKPAVL